MRSNPNRQSPAPGATQISCRSAAALAMLVTAVALAAPSPAAAQFAHAYLLFDARTGEVLEKHNAHQAWYPASVTKLMTAYVTFQALRAGRLTPTSPVITSAAALKQPPSKMGFPVGTAVTVDNALKIIMVKSANDIAWALGETVSGSEDAFVEEMNRQSRRLGMTGTVWGNPNGLPDPTQHTTARDLAILARALIREFPEHAAYFNLPGLQLGKQIIRNHNHLIDRFPGTDGMKTGFICASGFNVVATVTRDGRRLVAVVLGSPNARSRAEKAGELFTRGFESGGGLAALFGGQRETIDTMAPGPEAGLPVRDIRDEVCGRNRKSVGEDADDLQATAPLADDNPGAIIRPGEAGAKRGRKSQPPSYLTARFDIGPPVPIWIGGADPLPPTAVAAARTAQPSQVTALVPESGAGRPSAPGAIFPGQPRAENPTPVIQPGGGSIVARSFGLFAGKPGEPVPATGPASGAGVADSLPAANGAPMVIAGTAPASPATVRRPAETAGGVPAAAIDVPLPRRKPADLVRFARAAAAKAASEAKAARAVPARRRK